MRKPCCEKEGTNKGAWSKQEDQKLIDYIKAHGEGCWRSLPKAAGLHRCGKSCRLRWINYLRPDIKRGNFEQDEEDLIIKLHALLGNRWSLIAGRLPGRTDNEVKNYWNSHIRKKLIKMGIDPNNHRLNQIIPRPNPQNDCVSAAATSSGSMSNISACTKAPIKSSREIDQRASQATSVLEDETSGSSSRDLNLDLTIAFPNPPLLVGEEMQKNIKGSFTMAREIETNLQHSPTLALFR
ncbi:hypothetical protein PRUPE_3G158700 [Prunus persica]|uniref:R2R3-MYB transcription factor n=1 Tax=Prunus persica TaxID=3760 RepID=M5WTU2_PRUPE|nr:transcription factor MYB6 [Prunus persica]ALO81022.1 R2R3-MYB transcription factor [Prunus persica]ONI17431.1 hypothetical protein PRUPE_3G158700 [Prunus persica]